MQLIVLLVLGTVIFYFSMILYRKQTLKIRGNRGSAGIIEWLLWFLFILWTLGFVLFGMVFLERQGVANKAIAVVPLFISAVLYWLINKKAKG